jgi:hypothetical protein
VTVWRKISKGAIDVSPSLPYKKPRHIPVVVSQQTFNRLVKTGIDVKALLLGLSMLVTGSALANEVTLCFEKAWAHPNDGGLGMPRGSAVDLCRGATDMYEVTQCYEKAWAHPDNGGLGMPRGSAVDLCASTPRAK